MFNLMRQLGGSLGIAIMATMLARQTVVQKQLLTEHVGSYDATTMARLGGLTQGLIARGVDATMAKQQALMIMDRQIATQASVVAFSRIYLISGIRLVAALPVLLIWKTGSWRQPTGRGNEEASSLKAVVGGGKWAVGLGYWVLGHALWVKRRWHPVRVCNCGGQWAVYRPG